MSGKMEKVTLKGPESIIVEKNREETHGPIYNKEKREIV